MNCIRIILALLVVAIIPVSLLGSPEMFWELGPVENGDLFILLLGSITCLYWYTQDGIDSYFRPVWKLGSAVFFLVAAREASWGRIFMSTGIDTEGPIIPSMSQLWFGTYIHVAVGVFITVVLYMIYTYRYELHDLLYLLGKSKEEIFYCSLCIVLLGSATLIWDPNRIPSLSQWHQALEEMSELTAYFAAYAIAWKAHILSKETIIQDVRYSE